MFMRLSDTLQPQAPNEVETIAYVDCGLKDVGTYVGKDGRERGIARQAYCRVTLADRLNNRIAGPEMFLGRAPPQSIETKPGESQNASGASPDDAAMVAYIEGLPRR